MKRIVTAIIIVISCLNLMAETVTIVNSQTSADATSGRFETYSDYLGRGLQLLLDKYEGRVWSIDLHGKNELEISPAPTVENPKIVNFQLVGEPNISGRTYLLDIHTGRMWRMTLCKGHYIFELYAE